MADWNSLLDDPVFNMGLGLLSGAPTANPWGAAAEQLNRYQTLRQNREYQQMHSKLYEAQARKAEADAQQTADAQARWEQFVSRLPPQQQAAAAALGPKVFGEKYLDASVFPKLQNEQSYTSQGREQRVLRNPYSTETMPLGGFKQDVPTDAEIAGAAQKAGAIKQAEFPYNIRTAAAGAPQVSVKYGNSLADAIGAGLGKELTGPGYQGATGALDTIRTADRILGAVNTGKVVAGPTSDKLFAAKQLAASLGYPVDEEGLTQTRSVIKGLAELSLAKRKSMGSQISDFEQKMFNKATSGEIQDLTVPEIRLLATLAREDAGRTIGQHNALTNSLLGTELPNVAKALTVAPPEGKTVIRRVPLKNGKIGIEYSDGTRSVE